VDQLRDRYETRLRSRIQTATGGHASLNPRPIAERVIVKHDSFFAVSAADGSIRAATRNGDGVWLADTRILSEFRLLIDGVEPRHVSVRAEEAWASFELEGAGIRVARVRYMDGGLRERITLSNTQDVTVERDVELVFGADFAAMLAIRGILPDLPAPVPAQARAMPEGLLFERRGGFDGATRITVRPAGLRRHVVLAPGDEITLLVDAVPEPGTGAIDFETGLAEVKAAYPRWQADSLSVRSDNAPLNELFERSLNDLRMLCNRYPTGIYPMGGLPWFAVPFGRDPLITSIMMLPVNPDLARGVLRYLAAHQGERADEDSDEQPGKILHEVRTGEVVERGLWPHILFGTVDATPLFLNALASTVEWTGDTSLLDELWPAAEAAMEWCTSYGDVDNDGYIEHRGAGARNQGWKDSDDSLTHVDGSDPPGPAALCEVQAYLYRGLVGLAALKPELKSRAEELRRRFNEDFWMPRERFVAQALDGTKRQVQAITSNPGHCLWAGILPPDRAVQVAGRLFEPDMFSGWGIRTLSSDAVNYDSCSYHNGSVWPFDSAIAAAGVRRSGSPAHAGRLATALLEAGIAFPLRRLPELWCGDSREPGQPPSVYWNSCAPQAWSAGSVFLLLSTLLGLEADALAGRLRIAPVDTPLFHRLEVSGLHFAGRRIDFSVEGEEVRVGKLPRGIRVERD
jgi:glycogen debranching enzyme